MKKFQFQFSKLAEEAFAHFERSLQKRIITKLKFWEKTDKPLHFAKKLTARDNTYRFRIGEYRVLVTPKDGELVILIIIKIAHRREVYE